MKIAIIGGGAAGFFAAINIKKLQPNADVTIYERASKTLAKVEVSGGGRCNLTNSFEGIKSLAQAYPRGEKLIKRAFKTFGYKETFEWFETNGVQLTTQSDNCVFPVSQDSGEIVDTFHRLARELEITVVTECKITGITKSDDKFIIENQDSDNYNNADIIADIVVVTTGGSPKADGLSMLDNLPLTIIDPAPSLFSFDIPNSSITELTGVVVENATVGIQGTKLRASGALLITHWGASGPAILKLSSYGARVLQDADYQVKITINWVNVFKEQEILSELNDIIKYHSQKRVLNAYPYDLTTRLWGHIMEKANISHERRWAEIGTKGINRIVSTLMSDEYTVSGKTRFKDEFVTCGGVSLDSINHGNLEAKECENLYFAGEVLDVDAITGGFNLQAAWSTGYIVAQSIAQKIDNK